MSSFCKCKNTNIHALFNDLSFKDTLTNDVVSFEQLSSEFLNALIPCHFPETIRLLDAVG